MAQFYPNANFAEQRNPELFNGLSGFGNDVHVFYQIPFICDPSMVLILHEKKGILLLKVENCEIENIKQYSKKEKKDFPPFTQLEAQRNLLFSYCCPFLGIEKVNNTRVLNMFKIGVYLCCHSKDDVSALCDTYSNSYNKCYYNYIWTNNNSYEDIKKTIENNFFTQYKDILDQVKQALLHTQLGVSGNPIVFDSNQKKYVENTGNKNQRLKGAAGTGKTLVGAGRAVVRAREGKRVLYLYYNITLRNQIISKIISLIDPSEDIASIMNRISVIHYHKYIQDVYSKYHEYRIPIDEIGLDYIFNEDISIEWQDQYDTVIIDETQDFKEEYFDNLSRMFPASEFLFLADFDQNIYENKWEGEHPVMKNFSFEDNNWYVLKKNYRSELGYKKIVDDFCIRFGIKEESETVYGFVRDELPGFSDRIIYDYCDTQLELFVQQETSENNNTRSVKPETISTVATLIKEYIQYINFQEKNTVILSCNKSVIRLLQSHFTEVESMLSSIDSSDVKNNVDKADYIKKYFFNNNADCLKISTVNSYKGYDIENVIFLMDNDPRKDNSLALVYTALTRCKKNMFVIMFKDCGNESHKKYFKETYQKFIPQMKIS